MTRRRGAASVAVVGALVVGAAACNDDGRDLADSPPPTPPVTEAPIVAEQPGTSGVFAMTSPAFGESGLIESQFTCDGDDLHPPLVISDPPAGAVELAVVVTDESAGGYVHWVVAGLPASTELLDPTQPLPDGAVLGTTDGGVTGWEGPCPPAGDEAHRYRFSVFAFAEPVGMQPGLAGRDAVDVLARTAAAGDDLDAFYARQA